MIFLQTFTIPQSMAKAIIDEKTKAERRIYHSLTVKAEHLWAPVNMTTTS